MRVDSRADRDDGALGPHRHDPKSLLVLGIADRLLEPIRVREKMAASTVSLFMKRELPLTAATRAGSFC